MTIKAFWTDPYQVRHETTVDTVSGNDVTLRSTIFFALSGGQESDQGSIAGYRVERAVKTGPAIVYTLQEGHTLRPGQAVSIEIEWPRRYKLMRLHFAAELVLELIYRRFPEVRKRGAHIAQEKARMDFALPHSIAPCLPELAEAANAIVQSDMPVASEFEDPATERRFWAIEGLSRVPCGGTNIRRTGEVGRIKLRRHNVGREKERVEITVEEAICVPEVRAAPAERQLA